MKLSGIATRPPFGSRACAAMTDSSSDLARTGAAIASTAKEAAAALKGFSQYSAYVADAGLNSIATRVTPRCNFLKQFQPLAGHRRLRKDGRAKLATKPLPNCPLALRTLSPPQPSSLKSMRDCATTA